MTLLEAFLEIVVDWQEIFPQRRSYLRAVRQALGLLVCLGRRTLSRIIWTNGGQQRSWRAESCIPAVAGIRSSCLLLCLGEGWLCAAVTMWESRPMTRACARPGA